MSSEKKNDFCIHFSFCSTEKNKYFQELQKIYKNKKINLYKKNSYRK